MKCPKCEALLEQDLKDFLTYQCVCEQNSKKEILMSDESCKVLAKAIRGMLNEKKF